MKLLAVLMLALAGCNCAGPLAYEVPKHRDGFEVIKCEAVIRPDGAEGLVCLYFNPDTKCLEGYRQWDGEEPEKIGSVCAADQSEYLPGGPRYKPNEWANY